MDTRYSIPLSKPPQPPKGGYGFLTWAVAAIIDRAGELIAKLDEPHRHGGNPGYGAEAMLRATILRYLLGQPDARKFLDHLDNNPRLLRICRLTQAPSEARFSAFKNHKLAPHADMLRAITANIFQECASEIERLREIGIVPADKPMLGQDCSIDSTDVLSWARPKRRSRKTGEWILSKDPNAKWGHRTPKTRRVYQNTPSKIRKTKQDATSGETKKDEQYFGYNITIIIDANHGLPMFAETRPANASDTLALIPDVDACLKLYRWLSPRYFLGDKGYDSLQNILHLIKLGFIPIIAVRLPQEDEAGQRLYDGIYVADGRPTCIGKRAMEYVGTDLNKGHLFRCPDGGCHLKGKVLATGFCNDQHYEKPEGRLLRIVGLLPRCSEQWKAEYKKRTGIERLNGSAKQSRLLDQHRYIGIERISLHVSLSLLTYLATALTHLRADDYAHMRHMYIRLGRPRRQRTAPRPQRACRDPNCTCINHLSEAA